MGGGGGGLTGSSKSLLRKLRSNSSGGNGGVNGCDVMTGSGGDNEFARYASLHASEERDVVDATHMQQSMCNGGGNGVGNQHSGHSNHQRSHSNGGVVVDTGDTAIEMQEIVAQEIKDKGNEDSLLQNNAHQDVLVSNPSMHEDNVPLTI